MKNFLAYLGILTLFTGCAIKMDGDECKPKEDNFWQVATPSSQQMNENIINGLGSTVSSLNNVKSFLIIRNGKIVHEQYQNGAGKDSLLNIMSVTKRVTSSLVGIAIDKSIIDSITTPVVTYFPEIFNPGVDPPWKDVNVYHLLNMISGMDWVEVLDLPIFENTFNNPLPVIFSRGITKEPGTFFSYNSPGVHLLSYIIERSSHQSITNFANENLFYPLKINKFRWQEDGNHVKNGGAGLALTARDQAKIGLLYLQNGKWKNHQIISEAWINASLRTPVNLDTLAGSYLPSSPFEVSKPGISLGNTWWTRTFMGETIHYGDGYGGQILLLIPKYNIIVVMNRVDNVTLDENIAAFDEFFTQILPMVITSVNQ